MSESPYNYVYPQRVVAFYEALLAHLSRRYTAHEWSLCLNPRPGSFPHIQGTTSSLASIARPSIFAPQCFLSIMWWGDEMTAINASLMFPKANQPHQTENKSFNLSDPPFLVSAYLDALASTTPATAPADEPMSPGIHPIIPPSPAPTAEDDPKILHMWKAYDSAQARARAVGGAPAFLPTPPYPRPTR